MKKKLQECTKLLAEDAARKSMKTAVLKKSPPALNFDLRDLVKAMESKAPVFKSRNKVFATAEARKRFAAHLGIPPQYITIRFLRRLTP